MQENYPILISRKALKADQEKLKKICITSENFTLGRNLKNSVVVPVITISRNHCTFRKSEDNEWYIDDHSAAGIEINGDKLGKGASKKLSHEDIIALDPLQELVYKFIIPSCDTYETPRKKIKIEPEASKEENDDMIESMKLKFEESQTTEIKHIESKIESAKQMQTTSKILKDQLQLDMSRRMQQLESNFAQQIENLQGEKNEVEQQKALLLEERDAQLAAVKSEMEGKIAELMEQIKKHNESESELLKENNLLKEKLLKEREDFLSELSRESSSKQDLLDKLEARVREQEEVRKREKQELEDMLRKETEQLRLAKEKELKELEEQKRQREWELVEELNSMRRNLEEQVEQTEQQKLRAEQELNEQVEQMKKLSDEEKVKMSQLIKEREEIQNKLREAEINAEKAHEELKEKVKAREVELAALASERIQQQAEQSSVVINSLQEQLERVKAQLQSVETEKNTLLSNFAVPDALEGSSKESALAEVGELMDSELQCSICAEQFVCATTLGCSHTFCRFCITMWKKNKKDCPICRTPITSEVKNLVLDSFIEKMAQNLTEEVKKKREDILKYREELERAQLTADANRANSAGRDESSEYSDNYDQLEEEEEPEESYFGYEDYDELDGYGTDNSYDWPSWLPRGLRRRLYGDSDSRSDGDSSSDSGDDAPEADSSASAIAATNPATTGAADHDYAAAPAGAPGPSVSDNTAAEQIAQDAMRARSTPTTTTNSRRRRNQRNRTSATRTTTNSTATARTTPTTGRPGSHAAFAGASTAIATVDLTGTPARIPATMPLRPIPQPQQLPLPTQPLLAQPITITRLPLPVHQAQVYRIIQQQNGQVIMVPEGRSGGGSSQGSRAHTTAGTGAASGAGGAATGRPAAPGSPPAQQ